MTVDLHNFQSVIPDNEKQYLTMLEGVISSVDANASLMINKGNTCIMFRISPSEPKYSQIVLEDVLKFHNLLGIHLDLSKSIRLTSTISFSLTLNQ